MKKNTKRQYRIRNWKGTWSSGLSKAPTCNRRRSAVPYMDLRAFLAERPNAPRGERLVIELIPRLQAQHPTWTPNAIEGLAQPRAYVRITGWRMWDPEHPTEGGLSRGTLWEIHPMHKIEVLQKDGSWLEI